MIGIPGQPSYNASKFAAPGFTEAVAGTRSRLGRRRPEPSCAACSGTVSGSSSGRTRTRWT
ncbi:MAG: hypothetical protein ACYC91_17540 [Solirubrobacteraceae bacterium]